MKLLALAAGRRLHREQVIDALWPDATLREAGPRLHKAASYARSAVGDKQAIVIRDENVLLWPDADPQIDVVDFETAADLAFSGSVDEAAAAADLYRGDLLPGDAYEEWVVGVRDQLRLRYVEVLRTAGRWEAVLDVEPADEEAHLALMRRFVTDGQRMATLRQFERLERTLHEELGVSPSEEAIALRRQVIEDQVDRINLIDRTNERTVMQRALDEAQEGMGSFVLLSGPAGIGKSSLCASPYGDQSRS
jgi:DNA-binding SARP family transcriptional activator